MSQAGDMRRASCTVIATGADVAAFAASVGATGGTRLPTTYPIRWLTRPEVVNLVRALAADRPDSLPVHELQTVEMLAALPLDTPLSLVAEVRRTDAIHLALDVAISHSDTPIARLHAVLRLVP
ncbi:hypothetical protein [Phreatobacter sp.]|uniref:hypothetical protein n=1 Tax=Phreatobacter sp. TaxID=1966341 RepID=UPI0025D56521|nr:hypothetical protein [Phreatobacter sp.]